MSDIKHSPLPWKQHPDERFVDDEDGEQVANTYRNVWEEGVANAAYIVQACNAHHALVEAFAVLELLLGALPSDDFMRSEGKEPGPMLVRGRKAIEAARAALKLAEPQG